ncbi:scaffolding protein [uncultured Paenibacillus sp.]|uniref:phage scaffolding protein n=1 Tax=uncultured Paenibacillus sp. TaxID=227322 RepID=UPI0015ABD5E9|nr:scaffolding protein [uncultured Paenibacillus sp.]DAW22603.1 MAG TPA: Major head protein [Caudoviricetes sp.]
MNTETTPVYRYPLNLQLFAENGPPADPEPTPEPAPEPKLVPQDEVDRIVADRLARERKKYADYDDIKAKLAALEQAEEERKKAEMSEAERLAAELEEARKKAQEAEEAKSAALTSANQRLINAEFRALARDANIPADRLDAALKLADLSAVTVSEDGNVTGAKEAVEALVTAHGYLVEKAQPKPIGGASGAEPTPEKTKEKLLEAAAEKARKSGRLEDQVAYAKLKRELNL